MNFTILGVALLAAFGAGGAASYKLTSMHFEHVIDVQAREAQSAVDAANRTALNAAASYEGWKAAQRPKTINTAREVSSALKDDPLCADRALPSSLRDALTRAGSESNQSELAGAMPAASATGAFDLGRPRDGLFRSLSGTLRLPGAASGAR